MQLHINLVLDVFTLLTKEPANNKAKLDSTANHPTLCNLPAKPLSIHQRAKRTKLMTTTVQR
jgi:hypothetical protein